MPNVLPSAGVGGATERDVEGDGDDAAATEQLDEGGVADESDAQSPPTIQERVAPSVAGPPELTPPSLTAGHTVDETTAPAGAKAFHVGGTSDVGGDLPRPAGAIQAKVPAPSDQSRQAAPLAPSTRRFLRPLVGIDPDTVRVRHDDAAARIAVARGADAMAVGDAIILASPRDERDPATVGLIAHELTHVARARSPRFVPPIARGAWMPPGPARPRAPRVRGVDAERVSSEPSPDDEELMARVVEARVRDAALRERAIPVTTFLEAPAERSPIRDAADTSPDVRHGDREHVEPERVRSRPDAWGGLPAPWEPLPDFLSVTRTSSSPGTTTPRDTNDDSGRAASASAASAPVVHLAEREAGSSEEPSHAEPPAPTDADGPPDIDALARQVYAVLRRRLAAERRRGA